MADVFVLLPSVLLGPVSLAPLGTALRRSGRTVTEVDLTGALTPPEVLRRYASAAGNGSTAWVAHSNAGLYLPQVLAGRPGDVGVFVDASVPADEPPTVSAAGARWEAVRALAGADGVLPRWPDWWDQDDLRRLLPDPGLRRALRAGSPRMPLSYFAAEIPCPEDWRAVRAGYLCFDGPYEVTAQEVAGHGWPTRHLPGGHLTVVDDPQPVAREVLALVEALRARPGPARPVRPR